MQVIEGNWNGTDGALTLQGDKPTLKFVGGSPTAKTKWILHVGSDGPGAFELFSQPSGAAPTDWTRALLVTSDGNVAIGDDNPLARGSGRLIVVTKKSFAAAVVGISDFGAPGGNGGWFESKEGEGVRGVSHNPNHGAVVAVNDAGGSAVYAESSSGIGIQARGRLAGRFEGDVEVTGDIRLPNADMAEDFDCALEVKAEPGTVMIIAEDGSVEPCTLPYDARVAGVVAGAGKYKPGIRMDHHGEGRTPIALVGKVYVKADASFASIDPGDLLTTSQRAGHAMKVSDRVQGFGATIGKALAPLHAGTGLIPMLISVR